MTKEGVSHCESPTVLCTAKIDSNGGSDRGSDNIHQRGVHKLASDRTIVKESRGCEE